MTSPFPIVRKPGSDKMVVKPNLDYEKVRDSFLWADMYAELDWLPGGALNMAHEAIDRHADGPRKDKTAMIWEGKYGGRERYTFGQMKELSNRFANVLKSMGTGRGDRVLILMDRVPELYIAFFGILKVGAIAGPLPSELGPEQVKDRLLDSGTTLLITQPGLRRRISGIVYELVDLNHILVVDKDNRDPAPLMPGDLSYEEEMSKASADFDIVPTSQLDSSMMHYSSGTIGKSRGVVHQHQAVVQHYAAGKWCLDLHDDDVYWCTAEPGGVNGTAYGMLAPWTNGVTQLVHEGGFHASEWYEQVQRHKVTVWCATSTAVRLLMEAGDEAAQRYDLSSLRFAASVGGPLSPEAVVWGQKVIGLPFHDSWCQTEAGAILASNYAAMDIRPGSLGKPIPGIELGVLDDSYDPVPAGEEGILAVRPGWPSMFHTYWNNAEMYNSRFKKNWYVTGDRARIDQDGYVWLPGREGNVGGPHEGKSTTTSGGD